MIVVATRAKSPFGSERARRRMEDEEDWADACADVAADAPAYAADEDDWAAESAQAAASAGASASADAALIGVVSLPHWELPESLANPPALGVVAVPARVRKDQPLHPEHPVGKLARRLFSADVGATDYSRLLSSSRTAAAECGIKMPNYREALCALSSAGYDVVRGFQAKLTGTLSQGSSSPDGDTRTTCTSAILFKKYDGTRSLLETRVLSQLPLTIADASAPAILDHAAPLDDDLLASEIVDTLRGKQELMVLEASRSTLAGIKHVPQCIVVHEQCYGNGSCRRYKRYCSSIVILSVLSVGSLRSK